MLAGETTAAGIVNARHRIPERFIPSLTTLFEWWSSSQGSGIEPMRAIEVLNGRAVYAAVFGSLLLVCWNGSSQAQNTAMSNLLVQDKAKYAPNIGKNFWICHAALEDGRAGHVLCSELFAGATATDPAITAAECKTPRRSAHRHVGTTSHGNVLG
jgi:hypothetical protein